MKVLLTNYNLIDAGGSETFTYTMAIELIKLGHDVDITAFYIGDFADHMMRSPAHLTPTPQAEYDMIFVNHYPCLQMLMKHGIKGHKTLTCHGTVDFENPAPGADRYVAVSEEVRQHMKTAGYKADIIFNGVNCERFKPVKPINKTLKNVYSLCQGDAANETVKEACKIGGWSFSDKRGFDVPEYINESDLVVSLGRGAYEAMACGRNVLVFDSRHYMDMMGDGMLTVDNIGTSKRCNCSGRSFRKRFDVQELINEMQKYNPAQGDCNREHALKNMNIKKQVERYLQC